MSTEKRLRSVGIAFILFGIMLIGIGVGAIVRLNFEQREWLTFLGFLWGTVTLVWILFFIKRRGEVKDVH